jgi:hypothetical protein
MLSIWNAGRDSRKPEEAWKATASRRRGIDGRDERNKVKQRFSGKEDHKTNMR